MATRGRPPKPETVIARQIADALKSINTTAAAGVNGVNKTVVQARYAAAGNGRRLAGWQPPSSGPNAALSGLQTVRNRARDTGRNDWSGASIATKWTSNLVGIGISPRFKRIQDKARKQVLTDLWSDFVKQSDADWVLNFYGQQTLAVRSWIEAGEVFARRRSRSLDEGLTVPMQVQLLEAEMVPMLDADSFEGLPQRNRIRSGIEFNRRGRRIAYWFYKEHPGENTMLSTPTAEMLVRVPASDVIHVYEPLRPGALRGVSVIAPVITRLRNIEDYDDATLTRQQLANLVVAFISRKLPPLTGDEDIDGLTGQPFEEGADGRPLVGLQPGLVQELDDGQEVQWSNPPEAGTNYSEYMRTQHMGTAAGSNLPYEIFSGDIKEVSDRTLRVIINEFRRLAEQRQWQIIIPMFCEKVMSWFAESAYLAGLIQESEVDPIVRAEWSTHGWAHIHPVQDPQGKKLEVDAGFRSRSSVIAGYGDDPDMVDDERASDKEREEQLGLWVDPNAGTTQAASGSQDNGDTDGIDNNEYSAPPNAELDAARVRLLSAQAAALEGGNQDALYQAILGALTEGGDDQGDD